MSLHAANGAAADAQTLLGFRTNNHILEQFLCSILFGPDENV